MLDPDISERLKNVTAEDLRLKPDYDPFLGELVTVHRKDLNALLSEYEALRKEYREAMPFLAVHGFGGVRIES